MAYNRVKVEQEPRPSRAAECRGRSVRSTKFHEFLRALLTAAGRLAPDASGAVLGFSQSRRGGAAEAVARVAARIHRA